MDSNHKDRGGSTLSMQIELRRNADLCLAGFARKRNWT
jgi:hypothetical protein